MTPSRSVLVFLLITIVLSGLMAVDGSDLVGKFGANVPVYKPLNQYIQDRPTPAVIITTPVPAVSPTAVPQSGVTTVYYVLGAKALIPSSNPWDTRVVLETPNGTKYADKAVAVGPFGEVTRLSQGSRVRSDGSVIVPYMQFPQQLAGPKIVFVEGIPEKYAPFNPYTSFKNPWYTNETSVPITPMSPFSQQAPYQTIMIPGSEGFWPVLLW